METHNKFNYKNSTSTAEHIDAIGPSGILLREDRPKLHNENVILSIERRDSSQGRYRTYKRRWFGLLILTLLNLIVSWDWLTFAPVISQTAAFYKVENSMVNWLSSIFVFANFVMTPITIKILNWGLRPAFITGALLILLGNWCRYAGSVSPTHLDQGIIAVAAGQGLLGAAQSLTLSAPTRFAESWFADSGRVVATSIMTLANPLGAAVGQVVIPFWVNSPDDISSAVLYVSAISSAVALPAFFIPNAPPTPPSHSSTPPSESMRSSLRILAASLECYLIIIPFAILVGLFLSMSSLISQIVSPYGMSDSKSGIGGGLLILAGLLASAIVSPIMDRTKKFLIAIKIGVVIMAVCYLAFIWVVPLNDVAGLYALLCIVGASSLSLVPIVLEFLVELSHPVGPEVTSTIGWAGGQLIGGCLIIIGDAMKAGADATPLGNMNTYLIFQAALAIAVSPVVLSIGMFGRRDRVAIKRL